MGLWSPQAQNASVGTIRPTFPVCGSYISLTADKHGSLLLSDHLLATFHALWWPKGEAGYTAQVGSPMVIISVATWVIISRL